MGKEVFDMKRNVAKVLSWLLVGCMLACTVACGNGGNVAQLGTGDFAPNNSVTDTVVGGVNNGDAITNAADVGNTAPQYVVNGNAGVTIENAGANSVETENSTTPNDAVCAPAGEYNPGTVLVKVAEEFTAAAMGEVSYVGAEALYTGSKWYSVQLADASKTEDAVTYLSNLGTFAAVDYDYVMGVETDGEAKVTDNPDYDKQTNLGLHNIPNGWLHNGKHPGGSSDVVIAVIDTGVDYSHLDLRNNIWINIAEIPDNGRDDDGNGYVDDVYGWDCVGNDKDPMDDNGHGTHVAGIIAAENNKIGGVGVAYNCKVMVLKAGNSSGYFNNSDIAEAVQYAYMNGASVINMSFGGSQISMAVEEALQAAYNTCVLVAAAGNDGACNNLSCLTCDVISVCYPAALPYVIGVMSTDASGQARSSFSNYDHYPYGTIEYEVYAVGEAVKSTWPNNKYATLNGTSMAAPTVAGIAALVRSYYSDREMYSTKFVQSQIVNTGSVCIDGAHTVADVYEALTKLPKPTVKLYDYSINDSTAISEKNNGNGVVDAGETIRLYFSLHNRGGVASNVNVTIDSLRNGEFTDPYFTFVYDSMTLSDIGTYSVRESGEKYFEIIVSPDCPNDYLTNLNIRFTYKNGLDEKDKAVYSGDGVAQFNVSRGYHLPSVITEDTVFTNDRLYIVGENVIIPTGVTVTFEEGCEIQFYDDSEYFNSPEITVYGSLNMEGTKDAMIFINPSERYSNFGYWIINHGTMNLSYINSVNLFTRDVVDSARSVISNSYLVNKDSTSDTHLYIYKGGQVEEIYHGGTGSVDRYENCYLEIVAYGYDVYAKEMIGNYIYVHAQHHNSFTCSDKFINNTVYSTISRLETAYDTEFCGISGTITNNMFLSSNDDAPATLHQFTFNPKDAMSDNVFSAGYKKYAKQVITDYLDAYGNPTVDIYGSCSDVSLLYPHVINTEIFNKDGEQVTTIGKEEITVRVTFNRPMDTTKDTFLTFGTQTPYADYRINGVWVSDTVWEGTYTLKAQIENGQNYLKVNNACAAEDATMKVLGEYQLYEFTIDTTAAMAMNLFAEATNDGIVLTWKQDDYDTLMGYNIYRSDSKDGYYTKINPSILLPTDGSFTDDNAEPGKTYWYTFTVVLSDFSESAPAGKVYCTAVDTVDPTIYHTPVNQGYVNNNLVISCTASDNMHIAAVTLYYRAIGESAWKSLSMSKVNSKYSATIFGSDLTLAGLEYYIEASDGVNSVSKGTYTVVIKDASALSRKGDVDGNGTVTTKDALMLMQCLNGDLILTDDAFKRADLNGDGILSSAEALRILQYINGKVNTLDM